MMYEGLGMSGDGLRTTMNDDASCVVLMMTMLMMITMLMLVLMLLLLMTTNMDVDY